MDDEVKEENSLKKEFFKSILTCDSDRCKKIYELSKHIDENFLEPTYDDYYLPLSYFIDGNDFKFNSLKLFYKYYKISLKENTFTIYLYFDKLSYIYLHHFKRIDVLNFIQENNIRNYIPEEYIELVKSLKEFHNQNNDLTKYIIVDC